VEEYEKATKGSIGNMTRLAAQQSEENQPRLVYADRFDINAVEK
jgi:hypothetical protein